MTQTPFSPLDVLQEQACWMRVVFCRHVDYNHLPVVHFQKELPPWGEAGRQMIPMRRLNAVYRDIHSRDSDILTDADLMTALGVSLDTD